MKRKESMTKELVLSCIQPTGQMHIGNYYGAISNWVRLQDDYDCLFGIANLHSMSMPYDPAVLLENTINMAVDLLSCGINPANMFIQSLIPEHAELYWMLGGVTPVGELLRQTQFKDKAAQASGGNGNDSVPFALLSYPVLQCADILLYKTDWVPVGEDQKQHLELVRNTAERFNRQFSVDYFKLPDCLLTTSPRIKSLADPAKKMSKSLGDKHFLGLFEEEDTIRAKIRQAVTDGGGREEMSPGLENLFALLKASAPENVYESLLADYRRGVLSYVLLKNTLADAIVKLTSGFRRNRKAYAANRDVVEKHVRNSSEQIRQRAVQTLREVREIVGLAPKFWTRSAVVSLC